MYAWSISLCFQVVTEISPRLFSKSVASSFLCNIYIQQVNNKLKFLLPYFVNEVFGEKSWTSVRFYSTLEHRRTKWTEHENSCVLKFKTNCASEFLRKMFLSFNSKFAPNTYTYSYLKRISTTHHTKMDRLKKIIRDSRDGELTSPPINHLIRCHYFQNRG